MNRYYVSFRWKIDGSEMFTIVNSLCLELAVDRAKGIYSEWCDTDDLEVIECRLSTLVDEPELN